MLYLPVGFHVGVGGNRNGIGTYFDALDASGIPASVKSVDDYGVCAELMAHTNANHVAVFRITAKDHYNFDVPPYDLPPEDAAQVHWSATKNELPPEFDRDKVWLELINEPAKERADWLGWFGYHIANLANAEGYKVALFGWSSGTPEPDAWLTQGMAKYIEYATNNPDKAAFALHEYSFAIDHILEDDPRWWVGRFIHLINATEALGYNSDNLVIFITEFGWTLNDVPDTVSAMVDISAAADLYDEYQQVKFAHIWYLGEGYGGIADKAQRLIQPVTVLAVDWFTPDPPPGPDPDPDPDASLEEVLTQKSIEEQTMRGIMLNPDAALQADIIADLPHGARMPVHNEISVAVDGAHYTIQGSETLDGSGVRLTHVWQPGKPVWSFPAPPKEETFRFEAWPTEYRTVTQQFGANPDVYAEFNLPGHEGVDIRAPMRTRIFSVAPGEVYEVKSASDGHNYGTRVRIRHAAGYRTVYAHLDSAVVQVGDKVSAGQLIGLADNTGNSHGSHLHLTLKNDDAIPGGSMYIGYPYEIIDPTPFLEPFLQPGPDRIDMSIFFLPVIGDRGRIFILENNWSGGQERVQLHRNGNISYIVKNQQWEKRVIRDDVIDLVADTSPSNEKLYVVHSGHWLPRMMSVGETYRRTEMTSFYWKDGCRPVEGEQNIIFDSEIHLSAYLERASINGIVIENVAILQWIMGGHAVEEYKFAAGLGLVEWSNMDGLHSYIVSYADGQEDNVRDVICTALTGG